MKKFKFLALGLSIITLSFLLTSDTWAEKVIQLSPTISEIFELEAEDYAEGNFNVINNGDEEFTFSLRSAPYSVVGEDYDDDFQTNTNYNKIASWIKTSSDKYTLKPGELANVTYSITTPDDIPNGGQYAAILITLEENDKSGNIQINKQLAYKVYTHMNGVTRKEGEIKENKISSFLLGAKITASSLFTNTGNVDAEADITFEVIDIKNDEVVYSNTLNTKRTILPETTRFVNYTWENTPQLGIFKVRQTIKYLDKESVTEKIVFVCPFWLLILVALFIIVAIIWLINNNKNRKTAKGNY